MCSCYQFRCDNNSIGYIRAKKESVSLCRQGFVGFVYNMYISVYIFRIYIYIVYSGGWLISGKQHTKYICDFASAACLLSLYHSMYMRVHVFVLVGSIFLLFMCECVNVCFCLVDWLIAPHLRFRALLRHIADGWQKEASSRGGRVSFGRAIGGRRPSIELDARVGWHTNAATATAAAAAQLAATHRSRRHHHALAFHLETGARVLARSAAVRRVVNGHVGRGAAAVGRAIAAAARCVAGDGREGRTIGIGLEQLQLERMQLLHKVEVGRDVRFAMAHQREGVVEAECSGVHQVGKSDGDRSRDAGQTVDEHGAALGARFLCKYKPNTI